MTLAAPPIDAVPKPAIRTPTVVGVLPVVPAVVGAVLAAPYLPASLWRDEAATVSAAHRTGPQLVHLLGHDDPALALYYLVMHAWVAVAGTGEIALRLPSFAAAIASVLVIGALARRIAGPWAGVAASVLLTVSPGFFTLYAVDARPYALVVLCVTASAYVAHRLGAAGAEMPPRSRTLLLAAWSVLAAATIGLEVLAAPAVLPQVVWLFGVGRRRTGSRASRTSVALALILPVLTGLAGLYLAQRGSELQSWVLPVSKRQVLSSLVGLATPAGLALVVLAIPGLLLARRLVDGDARRRGAIAAIVALAWALLPPLALLVYSKVFAPSYVPRYYLSAVPGAVLLVAVIFGGALRGVLEARLTRVSASLRRASAALLALAAVVAVVYPVTHSAYAANPDAEDLRGTAAWIESRASSGDGIVYSPTYAEAGVRWYLGDATPAGPPNLQAAPGTSAIAAGSLWTPTTSTTDAATVLRGVQRVFVVGYAGKQRWVPVPDVGTPVAAQIERCWTRLAGRTSGLDASGIRATLWERPATRKPGCSI